MTRPSALPLRLWRLHRATPVGGRVCLDLRCGAPGDRPRGDRWPDDLLAEVVEGGGFELVATRAGASAEPDLRRHELRRLRTLADTVGPGLRLLLVGLNPSLYAADAGVGFARPGNRAWPALLASGLATVDRDPLHLLTAHRVGMTDLVKRATARADELAPGEFVAGLARLEALCAWLRPAAVCVLGVTGWRTATGDRRAALGPQPRTLGGRPVHVAPNPSGLNARTSVEDLVDHLGAALALDRSAR